MKKRLLSMLMAVLMIASLVPATALAAPAHADCDVTTISIKKDAAAKQPGIELKVCNTDGVLVGQAVVVPFAEKDAIDKCALLKHNYKAVVLQEGTCEKASVTITYCQDCGTLKTGGVVVKAALPHVYTDFKVEVKPTCQKEGWGYVVCDNCKNPVFVSGVQSALDLLDAFDKATGKTTVTTAQKEAVKALYAKTNDKHANKDAFVTVTKDIYDANGKLKYKAPVTASHNDYDTVGGTDLMAWKIVEENGVATFKQYSIDVVTYKGNKGVSEYTGDKYCPDCEAAGVANTKDGSIVRGTDKGSLWTQHSALKAIELKEKGYYPYIDKAGDKHDGKTDTYYCKECGVYFGGKVLPYDQYVDLSKVTEVGATWTDPAVAATCCATGKTAQVWTYSKTSANAKTAAWVITTPSEVIDKIAHNFVPAEDVAATCTKNGYKYYNYYVCTNTWEKDGKTVQCKVTKGNANDTEVITAGHNYVIKELVPATCSTNGLSVKACSVCGAYVDKSVFIVKALPHTAAAELKGAKDATCTEKGYTGDTVCKWCDKVMKAGEEIPELGHKTEVKDAKAATCTEAGYTGDEVCTVCGETVKKGEEIAALGHKYENGVCTVCGEKEPVVAPEFKDAASIRDYAKDAVAWAAKEGIVKGDDNGNFLPTADITRQDFVTMLWRLKGSVASEKALTFGDKADIKDYAQTAVAWAVENGYIKGRDNGNFDPAAKITRAEIVAILNRIADNAKAEKAADFTDIATHWAKDAIAWAAEAGIVNGVGNNMFAPNDNASRQDTVVMLYKFVNLK